MHSFEVQTKVAKGETHRCIGTFQGARHDEDRARELLKLLRTGKGPGFLDFSTGLTCFGLSKLGGVGQVSDILQGDNGNVAVAVMLISATQ